MAMATNFLQISVQKFKAWFHHFNTQTFDVSSFHLKMILKEKFCKWEYKRIFLSNVILNKMRDIIKTIEYIS